MLLYIGSAVFLGLVTVTAVVTIEATRSMRRIGVAQAQSLAEALAGSSGKTLNDSIVVARSVAEALTGLQASEASRRLADGILRQTLADNKDLLGVWTLWEPNAFDGHDKDFVNKPGHDATGRYIPYWHRGASQPQVEPLKDYLVEGAGDYYLLSKKANAEVVMEPYVYKVGEHEVLMTSLVVPIHNAAGDFVGVAGVDIPLQALSEAIAHTKVGDSGYAALVSNQGTYVAHPNAARAGKPMVATDPWVKPHLD